MDGWLDMGLVVHHDFSSYELGDSIALSNVDYNMGIDKESSPSFTHDSFSCYEVSLSDCEDTAVTA